MVNDELNLIIKWWADAAEYDLRNIKKIQAGSSNNTNYKVDSKIGSLHIKIYDRNELKKLFVPSLYQDRVVYSDEYYCD